MSGDIEKPPELARLEAILACCQKREARARMRFARAGEEYDAAISSTAAAAHAVNSWKVFHPDPQRALFDSNAT